MVRSSTGAAGTDLTASDVVLAYLGAQVDVVLAGAEEARAGDADAVHRVRVAIRRLRSTLRTFRPLLDRERSEPLREELRRLGGVLGALRDVQVVRDTRAALPGQDGRVAERLDRLLSQRGRTAHAAVTGALAGPWWDRLRAGLEQLRSRPPLSARADRPASEELTRLVRRADRRVRRRYRAAQVATSPAERDRLHHEVRKAAKRARYAAEAVAPAVGEPARRYAAGWNGCRRRSGTSGTPSRSGSFSPGSSRRRARSRRLPTWPLSQSGAGPGRRTPGPPSSRSGGRSRGRAGGRSARGDPDRSRTPGRPMLRPCASCGSRSRDGSSSPRSPTGCVPGLGCTAGWVAASHHLVSRPPAARPWPSTVAGPAVTGGDAHMAQLRIGIAGYGNLGRGVAAAVGQNPDMTLHAVFTRRDPATITPPTPHTPVVAWDEILEHRDRVDVLVLCGGSKEDLPQQGPELAAHFTTVDSFDTHARIPEYFAAVDAPARAGGKTAVISVGWDPGMFSLNRLLGEALLPDGETYSFWGPGLSQGHSDAVRRVPGVAAGVQYTVPSEAAVEAVRSGSRPELSTREKHTRECYVVLEDGADPAEVERAIVEMPHYFADYDTTVHFVTAEELARDHSAMPHGGFVIRSGTTGGGHGHVVEYRLRVDHNPEFTASVLVAYARAAARLNARGQVGAHTVFDVPPGLLSPKSPDRLRAELL